MSRKLNLLIVVLVTFTMLLGACAQPTPEVIIETVVVEKEGETVIETVEVIKTVEVEKVVEVTPMSEEPQGDKTLIVWWSHWANEPSKRTVIEKIAADYEAENPDVDIVVTWWDKNPLRDAIRSTMTAGDGAPDILSLIHISEPTRPY